MRPVKPKEGIKKSRPKAAFFEQGRITSSVLQLQQLSWQRQQRQQQQVQQRELVQRQQLQEQRLQQRVRVLQLVLQRLARGQELEPLLFYRKQPEQQRQQ